jgi:hypothetical protein
MPNISPTYAKIAEKNINSLRLKCNRGIYAERTFKIIINGSDKYYPLEKLEWMKDFLENENQNLATACLECLCSHGFKLSEIEDIIKRKIDNALFSLKVIEMAEKQNNPDVLLILMEEQYPYINRIILALKKMHREDYLTTLMLSNNELLVKSVNRITNK